MRKIFLALVGLCVFAVAGAQETQFTSNQNHLLEDGKMLFIQKKYGAAKESFERYLQQATDENSGFYADASYYIASIAYELNDPQTEEILRSFVEKYPYYPMKSRISFLLGKYYFEKQKYKQASTHLASLSPDELNQEDAEEYYFAQGFCLLQQKEYEEAKLNFMRVNYTNKYLDEQTYYVAYCNYSMGKYEEALVGFQRSAMTKYEEPALYHSLQIYEQLGNSAKSLEVGAELIRKYPNNPNNAEAYRILGEAFYKEEKYQQAVEHLKRYEELAKKVQREDMFILGMSYYKIGQDSEAIKYLSKSTTKSDEMAEMAYFTIGQISVKQNDMQQAKMAFNSAYSIGKDKKIREEALYNYVIATYKTSSVFGENTRAFNKYLSEYPNSSHSDEITDLLASAYITDGNYDEALKSINSIKNPSQKIIQAKEYVLFRLGVRHFNEQKYNMAEEYLTQSIELNNSQSLTNQAWLYRGETYFRMKKYSQSREDLAKFSTKTPKNSADNAKALYTIGYTYFDEQKWDNALNYFSQYAAKESNKKSEYFYDAQARIGDCYFYKRNFGEASNYYSKVIASTSMQTDYAMYQKAFIKGLQKNWSGQITDMKKLITSYPNSVYAPQAQYEIGRAYVMQNQYEQAIAEYNTLLDKYPQNAIARKTILEIGMLYENMGQNDRAVAIYKQVVERYPGSEQTNVALENMQNLYVENNDVDSYVQYTNSLGSNAVTLNVSKEDSLSYIAAEKAYAKREYKSAVVSLNNYLNKFCTSGNSLNCINATYYLADSYYELDNKPMALEKYKVLAMLDGNNYQETSLVRAADIAYSEKQFEQAAEYFKKLKAVTSNTDIKFKSQLGMLRCYYQTKNHELVVDNSTILLSSPTTPDIEREVRYCRMKSLIALGDWIQAMPDMKALKADAASYEWGAEASFLLADYYFRQNQMAKSEEEVVEFINKQSPFDYWIARSFVLMADLYIVQKDYFQAKQYLLTLQENYTADDDIAQMIASRLADIDAHYKEEVI